MSAKAIITGIIALMLMGCPYSGHAQRPTKDKEKARLSEILAQMNDLL